MFPTIITQGYSISEPYSLIVQGFFADLSVSGVAPTPDAPVSESGNVVSYITTGIANNGRAVVLRYPKSYLTAGTTNSGVIDHFNTTLYNKYTFSRDRYYEGDDQI